MDFLRGICATARKKELIFSTRPPKQLSNRFSSRQKSCAHFCHFHYLFFPSPPVPLLATPSSMLAATGCYRLPTSPLQLHLLYRRCHEPPWSASAVLSKNNRFGLGFATRHASVTPSADPSGSPRLPSARRPGSTVINTSAPPHNDSACEGSYQQPAARGRKRKEEKKNGAESKTLLSGIHLVCRETKSLF